MKASADWPQHTEGSHSVSPVFGPVVLPGSRPPGTIQIQKFSILAHKSPEREGGPLVNPVPVEPSSTLLSSVPTCEAVPLGILVTDAENRCVYVNAAYERLSGRSREELLGSHCTYGVHPKDCEEASRKWDLARDKCQQVVCECRLLRPDGSEVWVRRNVAPVSDHHPDKGCVHTIEDIHETKKQSQVQDVAEELLYEEKERAQVTLDSIGDAVISTDVSGKVTYMNVVAERMTGWKRDDALGQPLSKVFCIVQNDTREEATSPAQRAIEQNATVGLSANTILIRRDGSERAIEDSASPIHNRSGEVTGAVIVFHDLKFSEAVTKKMEHLAQHDSLTGLPNRVVLTERLSQALRFARRHRNPLSLLFVDLDNFKQINDKFGHSVGDQVLVEISEQLVEGVRNSDTVCRWGGDEFIILLSELEKPEHALRVAKKLRKAVSVPRRVGNQEIVVTLSIGISLYPEQGEDADTLLKNADSAMYDAKKSGKQVFFTA